MWCEQHEEQTSLGEVPGIIWCNIVKWLEEAAERVRLCVGVCGCSTYRSSVCSRGHPLGGIGPGTADLTHRRGVTGRADSSGPPTAAIASPPALIAHRINTTRE